MGSLGVGMAADRAFGRLPTLVNHEIGPNRGDVEPAVKDGFANLWNKTTLRVGAGVAGVTVLVLLVAVGVAT